MSFGKTLQELSNSVLVKLSMEYGTAVQPNAERRIKAYIQDIFDLVFYERYWSQYSSWQTATLDGATGVVTLDLTSLLLRWNDLKVVVRDNEIKPLPIVTAFDNPYTISGTTPKYIEALPPANDKIFKVYPILATGDVQFFIRTKPADFTDSNAIEFDSLALIYGASFLYAEDDATNLGAVDKFKGMFEIRMKQLEKMDNQHSIKLGRSDATVPSDWT